MAAYQSTYGTPNRGSGSTGCMSRRSDSNGVLEFLVNLLLGSRAAYLRVPRGRSESGAVKAKTVIAVP
jgi:hypothetical protein